MKNQKRKQIDFISERDFNKMAMDGAASTNPWDDSKGDSSEDQLLEVELGEQLAEDGEEVDEDPIVADFHSGNSEENGEEETVVNDRAGVQSSAMPEPAADRDRMTSTH